MLWLLLLDEAWDAFGDDFALDLLGTAGGFSGVDFDLLRGTSCRGTSLICGASLSDSELRPNVKLDTDVLLPDRSCREVFVSTVIGPGVGSAKGSAVICLLLQQPIGTTERICRRWLLTHGFPYL